MFQTCLMEEISRELRNNKTVFMVSCREISVEKGRLTSVLETFIKFVYTVSVGEAEMPCAHKENRTAEINAA